MTIEPNQTISFRVVHRYRAIGDGIFDCGKPAHRSDYAFAIQAGRPGHFDVDTITMAQPVRGEIIGTDEHYIAPACYAAVSIVETIDRGVVLIMGPDGRQRQVLACH
jgi:hypothetical protein